jgi:hypothetical protein
MCICWNGCQPGRALFQSFPPKGRNRRSESTAEPGLPHFYSLVNSARQMLAVIPPPSGSPPIKQGTCKRMKPWPSPRPGTQGQGRGITQVAAQRNLGKPLTARGAEPLSKPVSQWKAPVPVRRSRGSGAPKDRSGWKGMNREGAERFHGERAADRREEAADMDPPGAGGEGFGETSPVERGAPNNVGAGESPVPGMSDSEPANTGDRLQAWDSSG